MINMSIKFPRIENMHGITVYFSENAESDFSKTKSLIEGLESVIIKFRQDGINVPLSRLFKNLFIVKGSKERSEINENYKAALHNWTAFFDTDTETILFDLDKFKTADELINTLVHEIGHCIHISFVAPGSSSYITTIGKVYTDTINELKTIKEMIENSDDDEMCERLSQGADHTFYSFADLLDSGSEDGFSSISSQICKKYEASNKITPLSRVENMILSIMEHVPSEYGSYDEREFFAECFRKFILYPNELSLANTNMIVNAFTISRYQGKTVMKAHRLIKDYIKLIVS
jgi:hypothetical protein